MKFAVIDFETASACDLKKAGAWVYSEHPTTEIICLGMLIHENGIDKWTGKPFNDETHVVTGEQLMAKVEPLYSIAETDDFIFIAHNVSFEKSIWRNIMVPVFGWPDIPDERWLDTMASCAMKALPLSLDKVSKALRLAAQKDKEGTKTVLTFSRLNKKGYYQRDPDKLERTMKYCGHDCQEELELYRRVRGLGQQERRVWLLDQKINQRGVRLDMNYVAAAQKICDDASRPLHEQFEKITGVEVTQDKKFKAWLVEQGCPFPVDTDEESETFGQPLVNLQKETVAKLLGDDDDEEDSLAGDYEDYQPQGNELVLPPSCRRTLKIRSILGSASVKKLRSMQSCVGSDSRARWLLQYHGAGPGRWAGRLLQPQNFPRPTLKVGAGLDENGVPKFVGHNPEQLVQAILTRDAEYVRMMFGEPIEAVANGLRHAIVAAPGHLLEVGDFAQIEARIVLAIAGQHDKCDLMAAGASPYIPMAEDIFKRKIDKHVDVKEYTIGKNTVLGCGFQMGWRKFLARYCPKETPEFAQRCITAYRTEFAPKVPKLWYALEEAATKCVWDRVPQEAYGIRYELEEGWLTARLHNGKKLYYYDPKAVRKAMPWSTKEKPDIRSGFTYSAQKTGQWKRISAYGGLLTENVVQATAREMLVNALFNSEANGHQVVLTVHDEDVNEVPEAMADAGLLKQMMKDQPAWVQALRIPVDADCWVGDRYRK